MKLWMKHHLYKVLSEIKEESKKKKKSYKARKEETRKLKRKRRKWKNFVFFILSLDSLLLEGNRPCSMVDLSFYWVLKYIVLWFHYGKLGFERWVILNDNFDLIKC